MRQKNEIRRDAARRDESRLYIWRVIQYLVRRVFWAVPTLFLVSVAAFWLLRQAPGDPVDILSGRVFSSGEAVEGDPSRLERDYFLKARELGADRPAFYFELATAIWPDTFYRILKPEDRRTAAALLEKSGYWPSVSGWLESLKTARAVLEDVPDSSNLEGKTELRKLLQNLRTETDFEQIEAELTRFYSIYFEKDSSALGHFMAPAYMTSTDFFHDLKKCRDQKDAVFQRRRLTPKLIWHGADNQYHRWMAGLLRFDFGKSYADSRPVSQKIASAAGLTMAVNLTAILLAYLLAVPLGVFSARKSGSWADRFLASGLLAIYSMPVFWLATLGLVYLASSSGVKFFPSIGLGDLPENEPFWPRFFEKMSHLALPVLILTLHSLAFISRQMRSSIAQTMTELFVRTARSKGLPERRVIWRHALPNALFPMIVLIGGLLPASIAGSVAIEVIFQLPGMGDLAYKSFFARDWPVVFGVLMITAFLTVVGSIVADVLYAWADPRVRF